ncbi:MAG: glutathione S-transferase family protein [Alphaproteobacteria bacterium]|nr:glutathione S-transferase family protein [Alphaproteobacteria bacterium]
MARYTLIVGTKNWSSWSLRPYLALRAIGVPFDEEVVQLRRDSTADDVKRHSPSGRVPALKIEEGGRTHLIWDSLAICETLAERHPEARLWPVDPFVRAEARSYAAEMHSGFPDLREQLSMEFVRRIPTPDLRDATKAQIARILEAWTFALERHAGNGGFLFGRFSIADCMYAPVVSRFRTYSIDLPPLLQAYSDKVWSLPAMQDWAKAAQREVDSGLA